MNSPGLQEDQQNPGQTSLTDQDSTDEQGSPEVESGDEDQKRWKDLVAKGKTLAKQGHIRRAIEVTKDALAIHSTEKLQMRLKKMEEHLKVYGDVSDSEDEDADTMVHVGEGFYLYKELYEQLYSHQTEGILWLWGLFKKKKGGILGDDMGLGKTIQIIAFLSGMFDLEKIHSVLIVLPTTVLVNWEREFQKWAPGIRVECFHGGSKKERQRALDKVHLRGGVLITSYGMVVTNHEVIAEHNGKRIKWDYVILDEGHKIKNPRNKSSKGLHNIQARNRIILTGTPLMNNLKELWALFDWAHHGALLGTATTFQMQFDGPMTRARQKDATPGEQRLGQEMANSLKKIIAPFFLRRTKAEVSKKKQEDKENQDPDQKLECKDMPTFTRKNDLVIWVYLSKIQQEIYQGFVASEDVRELLNSTRSPLTALVQIKKICDHPRLLTVNQCRRLGLHLGDGFGDEKESDEKESAATRISNISDSVLIEESGKMVFLVELLDHLKADGHRCLVFSQSRKILDIIQKVLKNKGHKVARVDGTIKNFYEREEVIKDFTNDKSYSVFLLTTQVGGVGLTITAADRVVIFDPSWNPATDAQAIDRAFRIGQTNNVVVYRLITCGSIEEKIYRRQVFKDSIFRLATGKANNNPYRYFSRLELAELFQLDNTEESATQQQLVQLHNATQRKTDTSLDAHIAFLHTLAMYGISDHDLMFSKESADDEIMDDHEKGFINQRVNQAQALLAMDNQNNVQLAETLGHYPGADSLRDSTNKANVPTRPMGWNFPGQGGKDVNNLDPYHSGSDNDDYDDEDDGHGFNVKKVLEASMNMLQLDEEDQDGEDLKNFTGMAGPSQGAAHTATSSHYFSPATSQSRYSNESPLFDIAAPSKKEADNSVVIVSDGEEFHETVESPVKATRTELGKPVVGNDSLAYSDDEPTHNSHHGDLSHSSITSPQSRNSSHSSSNYHDAEILSDGEVKKPPSMEWKSPYKVGAKPGVERRRSVAHTPKSPGRALNRRESPVINEELVFSPRECDPPVTFNRSSLGSTKRQLDGFDDDDNANNSHVSNTDDDADSPIGAMKRLRPTNFLASDESKNSDSETNDSYVSGEAIQEGYDHDTSTHGVDKIEDSYMEVGSDMEEEGDQEEKENEAIEDEEEVEDEENAVEEEGQAEEEEEEELEEDEEGEEEAEDEDEDELSEEQEAHYISLMTQSRELYKKGDLVNALQYCVDALEIYSGDDRAKQYAVKLQVKLKQTGQLG